MPAARVCLQTMAVCASVLALGAAGQALAADADGPPVSSAGAKDVKAQIQDWVDSAPEPLSDRAAPNDGPAGPADRAIHGEVGVGIGSDGYRDIYGVAMIPLGDKGMATVAASETHSNFRRRSGSGQSFALNLALGDSAGRSPYSGGCRFGATRDPWAPAWESRLRSSSDLDAAACPAGGVVHGQVCARRSISPAC